LKLSPAISQRNAARINLRRDVIIIIRLDKAGAAEK
jgi:hypothetical protein